MTSGLRNSGTSVGARHRAALSLPPEIAGRVFGRLLTEVPVHGRQGAVIIAKEITSCRAARVSGEMPVIEVYNLANLARIYATILLKSCM